MGVSSIFGPQSNSISSHVQSICDTMEIPHLEMRWDYRIRRENCLVNLYPHPSVLSRVIWSKNKCIVHEFNVWSFSKRPTLILLTLGDGNTTQLFMKRMTAYCVYKSSWKLIAGLSIPQQSDNCRIQMTTGTYIWINTNEHQLIGQIGYLYTDLYWSR